MVNVSDTQLINHPLTHSRRPVPCKLTLADPDGKVGRDIVMMRADIEELHAKLARMPTMIARRA